MVDILLRILSEITPTHFSLLYKVHEGLTFSHFAKAFKLSIFQELPIESLAHFPVSFYSLFLLGCFLLGPPFSVSFLYKLQLLPFRLARWVGLSI